MGKRNVSADVQCPFYHSEDRHRIFCEGVIDGSTIQLAFGDKLEKDKYKWVRCNTCWGRCRIARMLEEKYK